MRKPTLFGGAAEPSVVCRDGGPKPSIEQQADKFASYLLMPKSMVQRQWATMTGSAEPYVAEEEIKAMIARFGLSDDARPTVAIAKQMASAFHVSGQAMQIRLVNLGLILPQKPQASLFG